MAYLVLAQSVAVAVKWMCKQKYKTIKQENHDDDTQWRATGKVLSTFVSSRTLSGQIDKTNNKRILF